MDLVQAILLRERNRPAVWETGVAQGASSAGWVSVNCSGAVEQARCPVSVTVAAGDVVAVLRGGTPLVIGVLAKGTAGTPDLGPLAPSEVADSGVSRFPALYSWTWQRDTPEGTYPSAWRWTYDPYVRQGDSWAGTLPTRHGYWFHNNTLAAQLKGVTVDSARIRLPRSVDGPETASVTLTFRDILTQWPPTEWETGAYGDYPTEPFNAGTAVSVTSATIGRQGATWTDLTGSALSWVQSMTSHDGGPPAGVDAPCIGIVGASNITLQGVDRDPESGMLELTWHR